jgi:hypothetical protein
MQDSLKPEKWWAAIWPILAGVGLAAGAGRLWRGPALPLVPPGDLVVPLAWAARWLQSAGVRLMGAWEALGERVGTAVNPLQAFLTLTDRLSRWEWRLRTDWIIAGSAFLILALGMLLSLWLGG